MMTSAQRIHTIRHALGLTQAEFATMIGRSRTSVLCWENSYCQPSPSSWRTVAAVWMAFVETGSLEPEAANLLPEPYRTPTTQPNLT